MATGDDILKGASRLFAKLGATAKQAGKQVTGLGLGTARVALVRTRFAPGDTIAGKVVLELPEPVDGVRLAVGVRATQRGVEYAGLGPLKTASAIRTTVYKFEHEVAGARRYETGEHAFELPIPTTALDVPAGPGPVEWQVWAELEIAWSRNLDHSVDIVVAR